LQRFTDVEKSKIISCMYLIDELIGGKFILFDGKANKLLKNIASSEAMYGIFAKYLVDYDFASTLKLAEEYKKIQGRFYIPDGNNEILAFVFCLILEVNNGKINLQNFINNNFYSPNGYNYSYLNFARELLKPFKLALMQELGVEESDGDNTAEEQMEMENIDVMDNASDKKVLFANLLFAINELHAKVSNDKKIRQDIKDEEYIVMLGLIEAVKLENIRVINALIISLEYVLGKQKTVRDEYTEVKNCMIQIYDEFRK